MITLNNVHLQFAAFFKSEKLTPFAFLVSKKLSEGHICIDLEEGVEDAEFRSIFNQTSFSNYQRVLGTEKLVSTINAIKQPFVLHNNKLYLQRYFHYESVILNRLYKFISSEKKVFEKRAAALIEHQSLVEHLFPSLNENAKKTTINWQLIAALNAVINKLTIITGGPGTGKTTTVGKILTLLFTINPSLKVALAAPTGKAAARMADSLKSTVKHRQVINRKV